MTFRLRMAIWSVISVVGIAAVLMVAAHWHLDEELRKDRWDRTHPQFPQWSIHASYTDEEVQDILGELVKVWIWVALPLLAGSIGVGYLIAVRSLRPVRRINRELAALDPLSCAQGVHLPEQDTELAALVQHINALLLRVGSSYHEISEFSTRVAHELRTPLTFLRLRLEALAPELPPDVSEELQEEIRRLSHLVERSLLMARVEGGKQEQSTGPVDLTGLLEDLHDGYTILAEEGGLALEWHVEPDLCVVSDEALLRQILHNLIGNAIRHGRKSVRVQARRTDRKGPILVEITNCIAAVDAARPGTGIGLRLVKAIVSALDRTSFEIMEQDGMFLVKLELPV